MAEQRKVDDAMLRDYVAGRLDIRLATKLAAFIAQRPALQARVAELSRELEARQSVPAEAPPQSSQLATRDTVQDSSRGTSLTNYFSSKSKSFAAAVPAELVDSPEYEVIKKLGRGGMGVVFLARHAALERLEVLKVLHPELYSKGNAKVRFLNEIRAVTKLNHPNIVSCYGLLPLEEAVVYAMEYVEGIDLKQFIHQNKPLPVWLACTFAAQIAAGLQAAHEQGLVHRDIKPANVMVYRQPDRKLRIKILDFGLAKVPDETQTTALTQDGTMLGTPEYMSPEQSINAAGADIRADIYSLGCTLYQMLTDRPPFTGQWSEVLLGHLTKEAKRVDEIRADVPTEVADIVARLLAKKPESRYQTPQEVEEALLPFSSSDPSQAPPSKNGAAGAASPDQANPSNSAAAAVSGKGKPARFHFRLASMWNLAAKVDWKGIMRRPWVWIVLVAVILLMLALLFAPLIF